MIRLKVTLRYCIAFYALTMLYVSLHELVHHFSAYLICGDWGYKTFNYFETACEGTRKSIYATYTGPLFTFAMMYVGTGVLRWGKSDYARHLGFALVFAQWPLQRMINPFFKMNDEYHATAELFGATDLVYWLVPLTIWAVCVPPLVVAYRSIENRFRSLWFLFYLVLFPYLLVGPLFFVLEYLLVNKGVLDGQLIGIAWLFVINEVVTVALYLATRRFIDPNSATAQP